MHRLNPDEIQVLATGEVRITSDYWAGVHSDRTLYASVNNGCNNVNDCRFSENGGCGNWGNCDFTQNIGNCTEQPPLGPP
jgi:hypothetical protein